MLTGAQVNRITDALLAAYTRDELHRMVRAGMDVDFTHHAAPDKPYDAQVFDFVEWADRQERVAELIACAYNANYRNAALQELTGQAMEWPQCINAGLTLYNDRAYFYVTRTLELRYLSVLIRRYQGWRDRYLPLPGIVETETRAAAPDLDFDMQFRPPSFEKFTEHGFVRDKPLERESVDDLLEALTENKRLMVLGKPGTGKTTTLWWLVYRYALAAQEDPQSPIPVFIRLVYFTGNEPALDFAVKYASDLGPYLPAYLKRGRIILLLDALNEMPRDEHEERVRRIKELIDDFPDAPVVMTCRELDPEYVDVLNVRAKVTIPTLSLSQQMAFLKKYIDHAKAEEFFWQLTGGDVAGLYNAWQQVGGTFEQFWAIAEVPEEIRQSLSHAQQDAFAKLHRDGLPPLLALGVNPYYLRMFVEVYRTDGRLPSNLGHLFTAFVQVLLDRESKFRKSEDWPGADALIDALAELAYSMQEAGLQESVISREWATKYFPDTDRMLYLAASATLLDLIDHNVRFVHQLLQQYFAAVAWRKRLKDDTDFRRYWPNGWLEITGWEEVAILLAGILPDAKWFVDTLTPVNPILGARCVTESGGEPAPETIEMVKANLLRIAIGRNNPIQERDAAGNALNLLGDPRPGVSLRDDGLPMIEWCKVPEGEFTMGSARGTESMSFEEEMPEFGVTLPGYLISKYPITNAQYQAFVDEGGYSDKWQACWTTTGWEWRVENHMNAPIHYGSVSDLPNHPVVGVSWYEAVAFCNWLSIRFGFAVRLPSEAEWEKAARGLDGRKYPWGNEITAERASYLDTAIQSTSAVGIFPAGESPYGLLDVSGNVMEWTNSRFAEYPYDVADGRESSDSEGLRAVRGGAWYSNSMYVRCAYRLGYNPFGGFAWVGFRVMSSVVESVVD